MSDKTTTKKAMFSNRQLEILDLISQGKSNKEIAEDLEITYGTVKQHLVTIFRMLGVASRGKVAIQARDILHAHEYGKSKNCSPSNKRGYSWRLVSAVAFLSADIALSNPEELIQQSMYLQELRDYVGKLTRALDGSSMPLPDGGLLVWFGHPTAHLDDADRACQLVQCVEHYLEQRTESKIAIGIGLASHAEVVPSGTQELVSAEVYRSALFLARQSLQIRLPLANVLVQQLAPNSIPWLQVKLAQTPIEKNSQTPSSYIAIGNGAHPLSNIAAKWGGLPFLKDICASAENGIAQWLAVESWPPSVTTALIDAIGNELVASGFKSLHIRLPAQKQADVVSTYMLSQIEANPLFSSLILKSDTRSNSERLATILSSLAESSPTVLRVYGIQALQTLQDILGESGIDRLVGSRLIILAGNLRELGEPQTSIRLLGPRPNKPVFSRVLTMTVPELNLLPEGIRVDLQVLLDQLSPVASSLILSAAKTNEQSIEDLVLDVKAPRPVIQAAIQELASLGLILPSQGNGFEFRDLATAQAIKQLGVLALDA